MPFSISNLPWLPKPPADFADRCRQVDPAGDEVGLTLQSLAGFHLSSQNAMSLTRTLGRCRSAAVDLAPLSALRMVVLSNSTFDFIADALPSAAARHGVALQVVLTGFDQAMQEALDPFSQTARAGADAILLALDHRWYGLDRPSLDDAAASSASAIDRLDAVLDGLARGTRAAPILSTVAVPAAPLFGSLDVRTPGTSRVLIETLNQAIVRLAAERGALLLDTAALAERVGTDRWFDPVQHASFKLPFASEFDAAYADMVGRLLGAVRGKSRKCLVLDLDNTLWGGVVGDEGVEGLVLGPGSARGESFLAIQRLALDFKARGVILAVSSKNDDSIARAAFETHPEMALKLSDLAVFQANWQDKPSNLEAIAKTLKIGLDALVLVDDNSAERAQVRAALPTVAVPELPEDPAWYPWFLCSAGYFEAIAFSDEDRLRAQSYAADARRADVVARSRDLGDYLSALEMTLTLGPFDPAGRPRIAQLINKTNQFNLTTRRYTEAEVAAIEADGEAFTLQVRLEDRFGDLGMISVIICRPLEGDRRAWEIDTWLMSCRVLGRRVEEAVFAELNAEASRRGIERIVGIYRPTAKNGMAADHFPKLGFTRFDGGEGETRFLVETKGHNVVELPFKIVRRVRDAATTGPSAATVPG
jgi:FkbH-like protein